MATHRENKCCRRNNAVVGKIEESQLKCITEHEGFVVNCLNRYVMETSYYQYIEENGPDDENQAIHE